MCRVVAKEKHQVSIFGLGLEIDFFCIGLCHHFQSHDAGIGRFKFNVPVDTFKLDCFEFLVHYFTGHESIAVFKVTNSVFKIDAVGFSSGTSSDCELGIFSIFL
jgi:hypothetical protein